MIDEAYCNSTMDNNLFKKCVESTLVKNGFVYKKYSLILFADSLDPFSENTPVIQIYCAGTDGDCGVYFERKLGCNAFFARKHRTRTKCFASKRT